MPCKGFSSTKQVGRIGACPVSGYGEGNLEIGPHDNVKRNRAVRVGIQLGDNNDFSFNLLGLRTPQN